MVLVEVVIGATGNYGFLNWVTIALCLFLLDDAALPRWVPRRMKHQTNRRIAMAVAILVIALGALQMYVTLAQRVPAAALPVLRLVQPFGIVNTYGLFAVLTTTRTEITVQGANDVVNWPHYAFKYKPGPLNPRPPPVAPHQPRLDWQIWFAALSDTLNDRWFVNVAAPLLDGSPEVLRLLNSN